MVGYDPLKSLQAVYYSDGPKTITYRGINLNSQSGSLLLDAVMAGRPRASDCKLFQMPAEILARIVDLIAEDLDQGMHDLKHLALVNSDCRQLAHARQFSTIEHDYSFEKQHPLLISPGKLPMASGALVFYTAMAYCTPYYQAFKNPIVQEVLRKAQISYGLLRDCAALVVASMPNLETLIWEVTFATDQATFSTITRSRAHTFKIKGMVFEEGWSLAPPLTLSTWPLRSLDIQARTIFTRIGGHNDSDDPKPRPASEFFKSLFQLCGPTLESLSWNVPDSRCTNGRHLSLDLTPASFPCLRHLRLYGDINSLDKQAMASILGGPLKSLALPSEFFERFEATTRAIGPYRDLETLVIERIYNIKAVADFVRKHSGLQKLYLTQHHRLTDDDPGFDTVFVPVLGGNHFSNLRSLLLIWGSNDQEGEPNYTFDISPNSLATICELTSLEQLALGCDVPIREEGDLDEEIEGEGWTVDFHQWLIDHERLRVHLQKLKNLKRLAFIGDTYQQRDADGNTLVPGCYYDQCIVTRDDIVEARNNPDLALYAMDTSADDETAIWEHSHLSRMIKHAASYLKVLPKLEWMLCGKRPMELYRDPLNENSIEIDPMTTMRDECSVYLKYAFGLSSQDDESGIM
ncbi:hypothetical protein FHETE_4394 [Fusarium heterosporum]|uniref:Uncharacterized protein n=1 Tax=Fusarium heterosporum TaxID=42747 RepID=A0A8H5WPF1_FUSHE|nr:hypothetical protein FHETE_4394 [Fusarium heterosporum]